MIVQVVYVNEQHQWVIDVTAKPNTTVKAVIETSGILEKCSDISLASNQVGIFGEIVSLDQIVEEGDRIEIYRSLKMDPMQARRLRAES